jgi:glycosyltransferase involved in cell wall biosynthesis
MEKGFSIVICSYNPDVYVLNRVLKSLDSLRLPLIPLEIIIIDNNSTKPILQYPNVLDFINKGLRRKCVVELEPGLTEARLRGYTESCYDWVVFFDDDNEPDEFYLIHLLDAIDKYPEVACWGPAQIEVELLNRDENNWVQQKKELFQQRNFHKTEFGVSNIWQDFFPYGTGLAVRKKILEEYNNRILQGRYNLSDRKGNSLSSGGDLQIVLTATNMGMPVGSVELMRINHLIKSEKSTIEYLVKQVYGTSSSYVAAHKQVNKDLNIPIGISSNFDIIRRLFLFIRHQLFRTSVYDFKLALAAFFGGFNARYLYRDTFKKPIIIRIYEKFIHA